MQDIRAWQRSLPGVTRPECGIHLSCTRRVRAHDVLFFIHIYILYILMIM